MFQTKSVCVDWTLLFPLHLGKNVIIILCRYKTNAFTAHAFNLSQGNVLYVRIYDSCKNIFIFRSKFHSYLAQRFLDDVVKQNVNAFLKEATSRYGKELYIPDEVKNKFTAKIG